MQGNQLMKFVWVNKFVPCYLLAIDYLQRFPLNRQGQNKHNHRSDEAHTDRDTFKDLNGILLWPKLSTEWSAGVGYVLIEEETIGALTQHEHTPVIRLMHS